MKQVSLCTSSKTHFLTTHSREWSSRYFTYECYWVLSLRDMHFEIVCITLKGLRSWMMDASTRVGDGFLDPMGRMRQEVGKPPREQVNIEDDYIMFFLIGNH